MRKIYAAVAALLIIPSAFADCSLLPCRTFTPMDFVWYAFALCVFAALLILHHISIEIRLNTVQAKPRRKS